MLCIWEGPLSGTMGLSCVIGVISKSLSLWPRWLCWLNCWLNHDPWLLVCVLCDCGLHP